MQSIAAFPQKTINSQSIPERKEGKLRYHIFCAIIIKKIGQWKKKGPNGIKYR